MIVSYKVLCESDLNKEISLKELLENEKVLKVIKSEFAKGYRNIDLISNPDKNSLKIKTIKDIHQIQVNKDDYADILTLAEDDANSKKIFKKDCSRIELVDIETLK